MHVCMYARMLSSNIWNKFDQGHKRRWVLLSYSHNKCFDTECTVTFGNWKNWICYISVYFFNTYIYMYVYKYSCIEHFNSKTMILDNGKNPTCYISIYFFDCIYIYLYVYTLLNKLLFSRILNLLAFSHDLIFILFEI